MTSQKRGSVTRRKFLAATGGAAAVISTGSFAQAAPIKIGLSIAPTRGC